MIKLLGQCIDHLDEAAIRAQAPRCRHRPLEARLCSKRGATPPTLEVALLVAALLRAGDYKTPDGSARRSFTGTFGDSAAALLSLGMGHVADRLGGNTAQECAAAELIAKMKS